MDTAVTTADEPLLRGIKRQDLQEMLREVGLAVEYWVPKLQEHLGVTSAQALQHLEDKDLQQLKSQAQYPWEKRALEKLFKLSHPNSLSETQKSQVEMIKNKQKKAEQVLQELKDLLLEGRQQQEEAVRKKEAELRQVMEIPKEYWPSPENSLREVMENVQKQLNLTEGTLSHRQNLPDRDLVRWASGGLALQGIYKTRYRRDLIEKRQELLSVPKEFSLYGPEQGTRMETQEFTSSHAEAMFTQAMEKLGFSVTASAKGGGWGFSLETGTDHSKHSQSKETHHSHSEQSYFCSTKFSYVPLASFHFPIDQLQFSKATLQELKCIEDLLAQPAGLDKLPLLRHKTEAFFHRFGSHANQGPLHLGGIYWWKAISEGFQSEQLAEVKQQSAESLNSYIRGSYVGFGVKVAAGVDVSDSHSNASSQSTTCQNLQTKVQLSVAHTGGPPEANSFFQWKAGLVASNQTWCVIDRGLQLVPIWDIILSNHRSDFKDPLQEIDFLLNEMQTAQDKYQELKTICTYRAQAFLVLLSLTATVGVTALSPEDKTQRLALIRHHMGQSLTEEIVHVLSKLGAGHDWENLEKDLRLLIDGNFEATISSLQMDEVRKNLQSIFHEKDQPHEPHNNENSKLEVIEDGAFQELLQRLGLEHYYPKRMSRANFHLIYKASVYNSQPSSEQELPFYFLQKLLMLDYELRYLVFRDDGNTQNEVYPSALNQEKKAFDPYEGLFEDPDAPTNPSATNPRPHIHPMDIQMAILHCADDFARQYILAKLAICQFALPFLIPNPCSSEIEFSLWSLRQIRRSWQEARKSPKEDKNNYKNKQMCCVSTPVVSFIRVGNGFSASKSQIMNCLLSKRKHDIFFHRHCRGSSKDCLLMGGVVEVCWFCPGGEDEERFDTCLTFTNLHGDAKEHEKQLTFLQEVSSLIVVLMSTSDDNKENRKIVRDLSQSPRPLICLLDNKEKTMANNSNQKVIIGIRNRNEGELTEELITTIRRLLQLSDTVLSIEDCSHIARKHGFLIDEDKRECKEAKEKAEILMALLKETKISQVKENLLPLQGQLWHLWCKKDKELYHLREKGNRSIEQHKCEIETEKQRIRHEQLTRAFPLNDLIQSVLEILQTHSETHTTLYFFQWLGMFLNNLTAGHLEKLNEEKKSVWTLIQTEKRKGLNSNNLKGWQNQVEAISIEISDCTLGIEQLLREDSLYL
ncbi:PREDICTED: interferon-induced very large GTPase 1-like [Hipposideros armiger]|uniref:Interferon-induced very large GTPase 1-like n=1 Tax=Hipposideros armiger TaxID=186990 RepID=A0A8B7QHH2_HIPAR|nr:PREDICTED: interferon-induced very large GTPase 1-like [Hipposideros armiger]